MATEGNGGGPVSILCFPGKVWLVMARVVSNRIQVSKALLGLSSAFSLRRKVAGGNKRLGEELIDTAAAAIEDRSVNRQSDPSGNPWAALSPVTIRRKAAAGHDLRINIETFEMLAFEQIRGGISITEHEATMQAGLDPETRAKVQWAEEGGPNRPARPFFDLGRDGEAAVDVLCEEVVTGAIREAERV